MVPTKKISPSPAQRPAAQVANLTLSRSKAMARPGFISALLLRLIAAGLSQAQPAPLCPIELTFYRTGWGINQKTGPEVVLNLYDRSVDSDSYAGFKDLGVKTMFDGDPSGQVLTVMRGVEDIDGLDLTTSPSTEYELYNSMSAAIRKAEVNRIYERTIKKIDTSIARGNRVFELQTIQDMDSNEYRLGGKCQEAVTLYTSIVEDANDRVIRHYAKSYNVKSHGHFGSNDAAAISRAYKEGREYDTWSSYNGRAMFNDITKLAQILGAEKVAIWHTLGDFVGGSGATNSSLSNVRVQARIKALMPNIRVFEVKVLTKPEGLRPKSVFNKIRNWLVGGDTHVLNMYPTGSFTYREMTVGHAKYPNQVKYGNISEIKPIEIHTMMENNSPLLIPANCGPGGVSMQMLINEARVNRHPNGELTLIREELGNARPTYGSMSWSPEARRGK